MGYRDREWCTAKCGNLTCDRNITPEVRAKARAWWGKDDVPFWFNIAFEADCPDKLPVMENA